MSPHHTRPWSKLVRLQRIWSPITTCHCSRFSFILPSTHHQSSSSSINHLLLQLPPIKPITFQLWFISLNFQTWQAVGHQTVGLWKLGWVERHYHSMASITTSISKAGAKFTVLNDITLHQPHHSAPSMWSGIGYQLQTCNRESRAKQTECREKPRSTHMKSLTWVEAHHIF